MLLGFANHSPKAAPSASTSDTSRQPSPIIWQDFIGYGSNKDHVLVLDDFLGLGLRGSIDGDDELVIANLKNFVSEGGNWYAWMDDGDSIVGLATAITGVAVLTTDATDNDAVTLKYGNTSSNQAVITSASGKAFWYETRVKFPQITAQNIYIGLAEENLVDDDGIFSDAGAIADKDAIGFTVRADGTSTLEMIHNKAGGTLVDEGDALTIVADTWYKLGLKYTPAGRDPQKLEWFVDGVLVDTTLSAAIAGANFPSGEELSLYYGLKNGTGAARTFQVDWVAMACEV